jgi:hypothetical protein
MLPVFLSFLRCLAFSQLRINPVEEPHQQTDGKNRLQVRS